MPHRRTQRRRTRTFVLTALVTAAVLTPTAAAFANASSAINNYGPVAGYSYYNQATLTTTNPSNVIGGTTVGRQGSGSVPAGYMGATARLFTGSGTLVAESGYAFNGAAASSFVRGVSYGTHGSYYSYGVSAALDGGGHALHYTYITPTQNW